MHALYCVCEIILTQDTETQKMGNFASYKYHYSSWCVIVEKTDKNYTEHMQLLI